MFFWIKQQKIHSWLLYFAAIHVYVIIFIISSDVLIPWNIIYCKLIIFQSQTYSYKRKRWNLTSNKIIAISLICDTTVWFYFEDIKCINDGASVSSEVSLDCGSALGCTNAQTPIRDICNCCTFSLHMTVAKPAFYKSFYSHGWHTSAKRGI